MGAIDSQTRPSLCYTIVNSRHKGNEVKHSILAPLCSALVLPGLGQIINRQFIKGFVLMGALTLIFLSAMVKLVLDISIVMNRVMGPDLAFGREKWDELLAGLRQQNLTVLYILLLLGVALWAYSVVDAYIYGRRYQPPVQGE